MADMVPEQPRKELNGAADSLRQERELLQRWADELQKKEESLREMEEKFHGYRAMLFELLREQSEQEMPMDENFDLEKWALEQGAVPSEVVMAELEKLVQGEE